MRDRRITHKIRLMVHNGRIVFNSRMRSAFKLGGKVSRIFRYTDKEKSECTNDLPEYPN